MILKFDRDFELVLRKAHMFAKKSGMVMSCELIMYFIVLDDLLKYRYLNRALTKSCHYYFSNTLVFTLRNIIKTNGEITCENFIETYSVLVGRPRIRNNKLQ